tara:strand:- start:1700 stop:2362 length:663 start_codon:yes stop_codon:yes gene_type:complete
MQLNLSHYLLLSLSTRLPTGSGQSNMELSLKFTFERNNTVAKILNGTYDNIRVFLNPHVTMPSPMWVDDGMHVAAKSSSSGPLEYQWRHLNELVNATDVQGSDIMPFSAACLYMGTGLTDLMHAAEQPEKRGAAAAVIPLGMMGTSLSTFLLVRQPTPTTPTNSHAPSTPPSTRRCLVGRHTHRAVDAPPSPACVCQCLVHGLQRIYRRSSRDGVSARAP